MLVAPGKRRMASRCAQGVITREGDRLPVEDEQVKAGLQHLPTPLHASAVVVEQARC
jgi:hypothetical protein